MIFQRTFRLVNLNTHQKFIFCTLLRMAAGVALCICPGLPRAVS